jgi:hypothetical protein
MRWLILPASFGMPLCVKSRHASMPRKLRRLLCCNHHRKQKAQRERRVITDEDLLVQLRNYPEEQMPPLMLARLKKTAAASGSNYSLLEVPYTGSILVLLHKTPKPSMAAIRQALAWELDVLPTAGSMQ